MTEERAILLWRLSQAGLSPRIFGDDIPGNKWTNTKLEAILKHIEDHPPTKKQIQTFLQAYRKRQENRS